jgi:hypothetical protein
MQPGLVHQRQQPERPQGHGLAARVRARDKQRREPVAEADVDRHDPPGEPRVARGQQDDLWPFGGLGADGAHLARELRLGRPQVEPGERGEGLAQRPGIGADERRQLVEDALDLLPFGELRLAPRVAELDDDEGLDEQGLPAARRVMDDALHPALRIGPHRHDVAAVPEGDDRFLEGARELRRHE